MKYLNRTFRNTEDLYLKFQTMFPNIPVLHWREYKDKKVSDKCWKIPNILDLHYSNKYWQEKRTRNGTFYLYAAYYDVRKVLEVSILHKSSTGNRSHSSC